MASIRLVTLNTWKADGDYQSRLQAMAEDLAALDPHILCLQEVFAAASLGLDTAASLSARLGMNCQYLPARRKSRQFGSGDVDSTSGLAILSRLPVLWTQRLDLPDDPLDGERIAQMAAFDLGSERLLLVNLHLTHLRQAEALRRQQLERIFAAIDAGDGWSASVLAGDFNAGRRDGLFRRLPAAAGWVVEDARAAAREPQRPTLLGVSRGGCVDHLLLYRKRDSALRVTGARRVLDQPRPVPPSDHFGLMVDFSECRSGACAAD